MRSKVVLQILRPHSLCHPWEPLYSLEPETAFKSDFEGVRIYARCGSLPVFASCSLTPFVYSFSRGLRLHFVFRIAIFSAGSRHRILIRFNDDFYLETFATSGVCTWLCFVDEYHFWTPAGYDFCCIVKFSFPVLRCSGWHALIHGKAPGLFEVEG